MLEHPILPRREQVPEEFHLPFHDEEVGGLVLRRFGFPGGLVDRSRAILCVPGLAASGRSFARLRPLATRYDLRMLTGPLAVPFPGNPIDTLGEVMGEYLGRLERPVLLGTSYGSVVALKAALSSATKLRGLILTAALTGGAMVPRRYAAFAGAMLAPRPFAWLAAPLAARVLGGRKLDRDAHRELVRESRLVSPAEMYRRVNAVLSADYAPLLERLHVPTLVIHGSRDHIIPRRMARRMADRLPNCRYLEIPGAGHVPYLSHPREFIERVEPFLSELFADVEAHGAPVH